MKITLEIIDQACRKIDELESRCVGYAAKDAHLVQTLRSAILLLTSRKKITKQPDRYHFDYAVSNLKISLPDARDDIEFIEEFFNTIYTGNQNE